MIVLYIIFWYLKCEISRNEKHNVGRLVYDYCHTEVIYRLFTQSSQYQWNDLILMLDSCYHKICQNQGFVPWRPDLCGCRSCWYFGKLEVSIDLFEELSDDLVFEATKYCRIFEFLIQICDVDNCYWVTGLTKV